MADSITIARQKNNIFSVLGDLRKETVPSYAARFNSRGDLSVPGITEDATADRTYWYHDGVTCAEFWKGWFPTARWAWGSNRVTQFSRNDVETLLRLLPNAPDPIGEFNFCFGPATDGDTAELQSQGRYTERLYAVYQATDGKYYKAKGNTTFDGWDSYEELVFVPSGAYHPSIAFDESGYLAVAAEFKPAGGQIELWLYSYPYGGNAVRVIVSGEYARTPFLFLDLELDLLFFYGNSTSLKYRAKSESYATEHLLPLTSSEHVQVQAIRWFTQADGFRHIIVVYTLGTDPTLRYFHTCGFHTERVEEEMRTGASCVGLLWELVDTGTIEKSSAEAESAQVGICVINWELIATVNHSSAESEATAVSLQAISWQEITIASQSFAESETAAVGVTSILWMQP